MFKTRYIGQMVDSHPLLYRDIMTAPLTIYTKNTAVEAKYADTASGTSDAIAVYRGGPGRQMYRSQLSFTSLATM